MSSARYRKENEVATCRMPPPQDQWNFMTFLWNPKTRTVLCRSRSSWAKIVCFYIVFYAFLAAFFGIMMAVFYQTFTYDAPKYTGADSLLVNPGLGLRPRTNFNDLRPTITYDPLNPHSYASYVDSMSKFFEPYKSRPSNAEDCSPGDGYRKEGDPVCYFDVSSLTNTCSPDKLWGYNTKSPCILLKLNKMFHWKPQAPESLDGLPEGLQRHINASDNPEETLKQNVWVWCESEEVEMEQPSPGLPLSYFPYHKQDGYLAPFALVRLLNLPVDQKVEIQCRVWASNVQHTINRRKVGEANIFVHVQK